MPKALRINSSNFSNEIQKRHRQVEVAIDTMFMMSMPFLLSYSRHIKFRTIELLDSREKEEIQKALTTVHKTYKKYGFRVTSYIMDNAFETS